MPEEKMETENLEKETTGTELAEKKKDEIKVRITFVEKPMIEKLKSGDVFFKKDDIKTDYHLKLLAMATEPNEGKIDYWALNYLLKHFGWIITNHLNTKQFKALSLTNRLKKKVFCEGLKNIYFVTRVA